MKNNFPMPASIAKARSAKIEEEQDRRYHETEDRSQIDYEAVAQSREIVQPLKEIGEDLVKIFDRYVTVQEEKLKLLKQLIDSGKTDGIHFTI